MKFYWCQRFFSEILIVIIGVKMNLRILMKNHAADPEIGFLAKSISKPYDPAMAMPVAWELKAPSWSPTLPN